jgi:Ran GTPase-activating protein (RanGAP) involved in mRNA processing and transport
LRATDCLRIALDGNDLRPGQQLLHEQLDVQALFDALRGITVCQTLYMSGHAMSPAAASELAKLLHHNHTLHSLCVGDKCFGDAGIAALTPGLGAACSLTSLHLEHKGLSAEGVRQLLLHMQHNTQLAELRLSRNELGASGFAALCSASLPAQHLTLRSCGLSGEEIGQGACCSNGASESGRLGMHAALQRHPGQCHGRHAVDCASLTHYTRGVDNVDSDVDRHGNTVADSDLAWVQQT